MNINNATGFVLRTDLINSYLVDINKYPVLTATEERDLFVQRESALEKVNLYKSMADEAESREARVEALKEADKYQAEANRLREYIINCNQRFVFAVAKRYATNDLLSDLISVGNLGLLTAFDLYDWKEEVRLCSFAVWYIRRSINAYLVKENLTVRTSNNIRILPKVKKIENEFYLKNGRKPADIEIVDILLDEYDIEVSSPSDLYGARVESIDATIGEGDDATTMENSSEFAIATASTNDYEKNIENEDLSEQMKAALAVLDAREAKIVKMSTGVGYNKEYTNKEIAEVLGLTAERVRQIRLAALAKMKQAYTA